MSSKYLLMIYNKDNKVIVQITDSEEDSIM